VRFPLPNEVKLRGDQRMHYALLVRDKIADQAKYASSLDMALHFGFEMFFSIDFGDLRRMVTKLVTMVSSCNKSPHIDLFLP
jgi:hypothetical protein